jgi:hypothetical protein
MEFVDDDASSSSGPDPEGFLTIEADPDNFVSEQEMKQADPITAAGGVLKPVVMSSDTIPLLPSTSNNNNRAGSNGSSTPISTLCDTARAASNHSDDSHSPPLNELIASSSASPAQHRDGGDTSITAARPVSEKPPSAGLILEEKAERKEDRMDVENGELEEKKEKKEKDEKEQLDGKEQKEETEETEENEEREEEEKEKEQKEANNQKRKPRTPPRDDRRPPQSTTQAWPKHCANGCGVKLAGKESYSRHVNHTCSRLPGKTSALATCVPLPPVSDGSSRKRNSESVPLGPTGARPNPASRDLRPATSEAISGIAAAAAGSNTAAVDTPVAARVVSASIPGAINSSPGLTATPAASVPSSPLHATAVSGQPTSVSPSTPLQSFAGITYEGELYGKVCNCPGVQGTADNVGGDIANGQQQLRLAFEARSDDAIAGRDLLAATLSILGFPSPVQVHGLFGQYVIMLRREDLLPPPPLRNLAWEFLRAVLQWTGQHGLRQVRFVIWYCRHERAVSAAGLPAGRVESGDDSMTGLERPGPVASSSSSGQARASGQAYPSGSVNVQSGPGRQQQQQQQQQLPMPSGAAESDDDATLGIERLSMREEDSNIHQFNNMPDELKGIVHNYAVPIDVKWSASFRPQLQPESHEPKSLSRWADPPLEAGTLILRMPDSSVSPAEADMQLLPLSSVSFVPARRDILTELQAEVQRLSRAQDLSWIQGDGDEQSGDRSTGLAASEQAVAAADGLPAIAVFCHRMRWTARWNGIVLDGRQCVLTMLMLMTLYPEHKKSYRVSLGDESSDRTFDSIEHDHRVDAFDEVVALWAANVGKHLSDVSIGGAATYTESAVVVGRLVCQRLFSRTVDGHQQYQVRMVDLRSDRKRQQSGSWRRTPHEATERARSLFATATIDDGQVWDEFLWQLNQNAADDSQALLQAQVAASISTSTVPSPTAAAAADNDAAMSSQLVPPQFSRKVMSSIISCSHLGAIVKRQVTRQLHYTPSAQQQTTRHNQHAAALHMQLACAAHSPFHMLGID